MPSVHRTSSREKPSSPVWRWMDSVALVAVSAAAISSGERPSASDSSETVGSRPKSPVRRSRAFLMAAARSLMLRLTLTAPSSRRKRRISPAILGTA